MPCNRHRWATREQDWVQCLDHFSFIPCNLDNRHWRQILESGQEILPFEEPVASGEQLPETGADEPRGDNGQEAISGNLEGGDHAESIPQTNADAANIGEEATQNAAPDLAALKESLRLRVIAEAVRQSGLSADVLARVIELTNTLNDETADEQARTSAQLELEQHNEYRETATLVEAAKQRKLAEIDAIETVEDALTYSVEDGWP